ncbi:5929_t:CDS:1, partial [Paraglomus occultum]
QQRQQTQQSKFEAMLSPRVMDAVLTTVMGLAAVGIGGTAYHTW